MRFFPNILLPKEVQTLNVSTKKLCEKLSYEKAERKMLVKFTPGGYFTNSLLAAFATIDLC
jgi:hypothetical protein